MPLEAAEARQGANSRAAPTCAGRDARSGHTGRLLAVRGAERTGAHEELALGGEGAVGE